jgi:cytochrome c peroxidase
MKFDDLPARYRDNIDEQPPFDRHAGEAAALSDADIADIVLFLHTLSDGYAPPDKDGPAHAVGPAGATAR